MGLFADLLAVSRNAPPATLATRRLSRPDPPVKVAESQKSRAPGFHAATESRRVAEVARGRFPANDLERFAKAQGIDWPAARSQMIEGDAEAGGAQLAADTGDGVEQAGVACWLRLLARRAPPVHEAWPKRYRTSGRGLDAYGRPLPPARPAVTCGSCQYFQHDPINPPAGIGTCREGVGHLSAGSSLHPMAERLCDHHQSPP